MNTTLLAQVDIEELPPEVIDALPRDVVRKLREGALDVIPEAVVELLRLRVKLDAGLA